MYICIYIYIYLNEYNILFDIAKGFEMIQVSQVYLVHFQPQS